MKGMINPLQMPTDRKIIPSTMKYSMKIKKQNSRLQNWDLKLGFPTGTASGFSSLFHASHYSPSDSEGGGAGIAEAPS